jgi:predicted phosphodiesterase
MRYVLLSDVHANVPALEAVLRDAATKSDVTGTYHLGDLVGYAPWPNEVIEMIRAAGIPGVAGNYDSTVATHYKHCGCRYEDPRQEAQAHESFTWTLANTSDEGKRFLGSLPFSIAIRPFGGHVSGPTIRLVHGNHALNTVYVTEDRSDEFLTTMGKNLASKEGDVVAFGHTHKPWHRVVGGVHFVNTGSVGRPKDLDPRAGYVLLDVTDAGVEVEFVRVAYDVEAAAKAILASTLPHDFADYLRTGGAPRPAAGVGAASIS